MPASHGTAGWLLGYGLLAAVALATARARGGGLRALVIVPAWALAGTVLVAALAAATSSLLGTLPGVPAWPLLRAAFAITGLFGIGVLIGVRLTPRPPADGWIRGALLVASPRPRPVVRAISFAGIPVPGTDETKHFKLIGTTGTGKSTVIRALLAGAVARGDRAVVADAGGAYMSAFFDAARGDAILNPFEPRALRWDPFLELSAPYDYDQLARALVGEGTGAEQAWRHYARTLTSAVLRRLALSGARELGELLRLLNSAPADELRALLEGTPAQPLLEPGNERMFGSVRAVATASTAALEHVRAQDAPPFSVRRWVEHGSGLLFLPYAADQVASLQSLVSTWMCLAILETMSRGEGDRRLWFVVDELDALGAIDGLKDALARLRKYGGRCVLGFQSIAQVGAVYGPAEAQTIVENCGNTLILRCSMGEYGGTARFASALIGEREVLRGEAVARPGPGARRSAAARQGLPQQVLEAAVLPSEIEQLADFEGFVKLASQPHWSAVRVRP
jgi:hypothetical protein